MNTYDEIQELITTPPNEEQIREEIAERVSDRYQVLRLVQIDYPISVDLRHTWFKENTFLPPHLYEEYLGIYYLYDKLRKEEFGRDEVSRLAIEQSLCPVHFVDWAICFDDNNVGCTQVRAIFPHGHDT